MLSAQVARSVLIFAGCARKNMKGKKCSRVLNEVGRQVDFELSNVLKANLTFYQAVEGKKDQVRSGVYLAIFILV